ncbi:MAG: hypothetical protein HDT01_04975 [Bacteroidales bacterium]|nr:hypothetical protein [Bacteroidales bacterium]
MSSCSKDEPFDHPFIHIVADNGASRVIVNSDVNNVNSYNVYVSSKALTSNLVVNYEILVGDGLQAGRDFELVNPGNTLTFLPGIYDMPIRIRWKPNKVNPTKNNTLTIRLTGNNQGFTLGLPGPDELQRELVIEKKNP